jgi:hypothetical protein
MALADGHHDGVSIPAKLRRRYARWSWSLAWDWTPGGQTWRLQRDDQAIGFYRLLYDLR